jgi:hypothetical protein
MELLGRDVFSNRTASQLIVRGLAFRVESSIKRGAAVIFRISRDAVRRQRSTVYCSFNS